MSISDIVTRETFGKIFSACRNKDLWYKGFIEALEGTEINTKLRIAHFCAQIGHESASMKYVSENLNYSATQLTKVFRKYFPTTELALQYARKPEKIANRVYANRMGNGDEASGDGWRYRGRGLIQVTGKNNYTTFFNYIDRNIDVDYLTTYKGAIDSAIWYWMYRGINKYADIDNITRVTKLINGGTNGLSDRRSRLTIAKRALGI